MNMQGLCVKKTFPRDFEKIYPLLLLFQSPFSMETWRRIFDYQWNGRHEHVGYHLEKNDEMVGFMGLIFSCRRQNGEQISYCNITSMIVIPEYRSAAILLIRKLADYPETIFTCLGPINASYRLMKAFGFQDLETHFQIIPVVNKWVGRDKKIKSYCGEAAIEKANTEIQRILYDHHRLQCSSIFFENGQASTTVIYTITRQKHFGVPVTKILIHYISDIFFFNQNMQGILAAFFNLYGFCAALYIDRRFVTAKNIFSYEKKMNHPKMCSANNTNKKDTHAIYSELVLLTV